MPTSSVHGSLKAATAEMHTKVDLAYSAFDLATPHGYARFLWAHRIAAINYQHWFEYFAIRICGETAPDYSEMLYLDLHNLQMPTAPLTRTNSPWNTRVLSTSFLVGLGYTIAGSRLGIAALQQQWRRTEFGSNTNTPALFMSDRTGLGLWRKLMQWCEKATFTPLELHEACEAAMESFSLFLSAAHLARELPTPDDMAENIDAD